MGGSSCKTPWAILMFTNRFTIRKVNFHEIPTSIDIFSILYITNVQNYVRAICKSVYHCCLLILYAFVWRWCGGIMIVSLLQIFQRTFQEENQKWKWTQVFGESWQPSCNFTMCYHNRQWDNSRNHHPKKKTRQIKIFHRLLPPDLVCVHPELLFSVLDFKRGDHGLSYPILTRSISPLKCT